MWTTSQHNCSCAKGLQWAQARYWLHKYTEATARKPLKNWICTASIKICQLQVLKLHPIHREKFRNKTEDNYRSEQNLIERQPQQCHILKLTCSQSHSPSGQTSRGSGWFDARRAPGSPSSSVRRHSAYSNCLHSKWLVWGKLQSAIKAQGSRLSKNKRCSTLEGVSEVNPSWSNHV